MQLLETPQGHEYAVRRQFEYYIWIASALSPLHLVPYSSVKHLNGAESLGTQVTDLVRAG
jgi:hypothetical protein